ncbi:hypothetical protein [Chryseobacterium luteum]|nr:hypothetical protein [Chryseobacterium luteum]
MAVWIFAYGENGLLSDKNVDTKYYLDVLNSLPLDEIKIMEVSISVL